MSVGQSNTQLQDLELLFLGTASMTPSTNRNVSALALRVGTAWWVFDCGEGTQHQMVRSEETIRPSRVTRIFRGALLLAKLRARAFGSLSVSVCVERCIFSRSRSKGPRLNARCEHTPRHTRSHVVVDWIRLLCVKNNNGTIWIPTLAWERERERSSAVGVLSDASQSYEHESERKTRVEEDVFQRWGRFWFWNEDDERRKREQQ